MSELASRWQQRRFRSSRRLVASVALAIGWSASAPGAPLRAQSCDSTPDDSVAVRAVVEGIVSADNARDIERVLGYYRSDAVLHPPGEPPVSGREAIRPRYEALFAGFDPAISTDVQSIRVCGTLAVVAGRNEGVLRGRGDEEDQRLADAFVTVLTREGGAWSISRLMWHADRR